MLPKRLIDLVQTIDKDSVPLLLPEHLTLNYLCRIVGFDPEWAVEVTIGDTPPSAACVATINTEKRSVLITLSAEHHFSPKALARCIAHELLETSFVDMWLVFQETVRHIPAGEIRDDLERRMRCTRDCVIEKMLNNVPYWNVYDIPVPKSAGDYF